MNLKSLVAVVLRLIALNSMINAVIWLIAQLLPILRLFSTEGIGLDAVLILCFFDLLFIAFAVLLWIFAVPFAGLITRGIDRDISSFGSVSLLDCYTIAFVGIGLFYGVWSLPHAVYWSCNIFKEIAFTSGRAWKDQVDFYQISQAFIPFIVGLILLFKGRALAVLLTRKQEKE